MNLRKLKPGHALAVAAGATAITAILVSGPSAPTEHVELRPDPSGFLTGHQAGPDDPGIPLARILSQPRAKLAPWMGSGASDPWTVTANTWTVTLPDGRVLRLEPAGAMSMLPGETIEQARERFQRAQ